MTTRLLLIVVSLAALACDGGSTGNGTDTSTPGPDMRTPGTDGLPGQDNVAPGEDTGEPGADTVAILPDVPPGVDADPGSLDLGEECSADAQCASGLCFRVAGMSGCTVTCLATADCEAFGLLCVALREGVKACIPPPGSADSGCGSHADCEYPLVCREDTSWCALPECTWDGDCDPGNECEPATRRCQPVACVSTYECEHPLEVCSEGECGAPDCTESSQCPAGHFCHPTQLQCQEAEPCNDEGGCDVYNQACVDAICIPDLCLAPCNQAGEQCNPETGECGAPCAGHGDCAAWAGCDPDAGLCYPNDPPLAVVAGLAGTAVDGQAGQPSSLDGTGSTDPEAGGLTWEWVVNAAPSGSARAAGSALACGSGNCQFTPDRVGQYLVGLRVSDPAGAVSGQAQIGVWAK